MNGDGEVSVQKACLASMKSRLCIGLKVFDSKCNTEGAIIFTVTACQLSV